MNKIHFAPRFYVTEDGISAWWPVCGSPPILEHESKRRSSYKVHVTCKKCKETKIFRSDAFEVGKKICFTCLNADNSLFCRHYGQMDGDDDCSLWKGRE